ncbi:RimK/LysX family protein [Parasalinivibrio latis]|uniref:putative ATP-dependent zinc protease n=1 Tax=Parasalinivibrio latis TaxID=2952610 RepID=UPI0030E368E8
MRQKFALLVLLGATTIASTHTVWAQTDIQPTCGNKTIVGPIEDITIKPLDITIPARIDTGATVTSLHATHIHVENGEKNPRKNRGKIIDFTTEDEKGRPVEMRAVIEDVHKIRNAQGVEHRYSVKLRLGYEGNYKYVDVNLRDRHKMKYKLLIGRDWLAGDYLVDVEKGKS